MNNTAVITLGRFNPPTRGHKLVFSLVNKLAKNLKATPLIYLSHSQDNIRNPIDYETKYNYLESSGVQGLVKDYTVKNWHDAVKYNEDKFKKLILVVGDDRFEQISDMIDRLNSTVLIDLVSSGSRTGTKGLSSLSSSKLRQYAQQGRCSEFLADIFPNKKDLSQEVMLYFRIRGVQLPL